jgi:hypothetical protein
MQQLMQERSHQYIFRQQPVLQRRQSHDSRAIQWGFLQRVKKKNEDERDVEPNRINGYRMRRPFWGFLWSYVGRQLKASKNLMLTPS